MSDSKSRRATKTRVVYYAGPVSGLRDALYEQFVPDMLVAQNKRRHEIQCEEIVQIHEKPATT